MPGFRFAGIAAGIKANGRPDLGLIAAAQDAVVAALFTRNRVRAAPVEVARTRARRHRARAVLVNSGNANACTGKPGMAAALRSTRAVARALGVDAAAVLPASTGVIGRTLPVELIEAAAREARRRSRGRRRRAVRARDHDHRPLAETGERVGADPRSGLRDRPRHRKGRRHDPPEHGDDARVRRDRRERASRVLGTRAPRAARTRRSTP